MKRILRAAIIVAAVAVAVVMAAPQSSPAYTPPSDATPGQWSNETWCPYTFMFSTGQQRQFYWNIRPYLLSAYNAAYATMGGRGKSNTQIKVEVWAISPPKKPGEAAYWQNRISLDPSLLGTNPKVWGAYLAHETTHILFGNYTDWFHKWDVTSSMPLQNYEVFLDESLAYLTQYSVYPKMWNAKTIANQWKWCVDNARTALSGLQQKFEFMSWYGTGDYAASAFAAIDGAGGRLKHDLMFYNYKPAAMDNGVWHEKLDNATYWLLQACRWQLAAQGMYLTTVAGKMSNMWATVDWLKYFGDRYLLSGVTEDITATFELAFAKGYGKYPNIGMIFDIYGGKLVRTEFYSHLPDHYQITEDPRYRVPQPIYSGGQVLRVQYIATVMGSETRPGFRLMVTKRNDLFMVWQFKSWLTAVAGGYSLEP